jgi:ribosomal protein S18 acetylase RimI-like enzyme
MPPVAPRIRRARPEELDTISKLLMRAYAEYEAAFPSGEAWSRYLSDVADVRGRWGRSSLVVAELDGALAGSVDYYPPSSGGYAYPGVPFPSGWAAFRCLGTDPDRRGAGVGRALVEHLIAQAREDGATHLAMHSAPAMATAVGLYQRMGFRRLPEHDFTPRPGSRLRVLAFGLALDRRRAAGDGLSP